MSSEHEWQLDRLGMITASAVGSWLGGAKAQETYARTKAAESLTAEYTQARAPALDWGHATEPQAIEYLSEKLDLELLQPGFLEHPGYLRVGCTPDALAKLPGLMQLYQIKCAHIPKNHVSHLLDGADKENVLQVQCEMWIVEQVYSTVVEGHLVYFDPRFPEHLRCKLYPVELTRPDRIKLADAAKKIESRLLSIIEELEGGTP